MKKLTFILSLTLLCLLTDCSKKDAVAPEKAERIAFDDGSSSASTLKVIPNYRQALVVFEFGSPLNCFLGSGVCNITIIKEKLVGGGFHPGNGNKRALASVINGKFVLEFIGNHSHPQLNGPSFVMDADLVLPVNVTDKLDLQPGHTITQGSYPIISGPGSKKTVVF